MNDSATAGGENADFTNEQNRRPSKTPNETSTMIKPRADYSQVVDLGDENNAIEETEDKREKSTCRICEETEAVVAFKPCGHIVICTGI